jgi:cardiolipin synthase
MNPANLLTALRLVLIPVVLAAIWRYNSMYPEGGEMWRYAACWLVLVAAISDVLDGYVARRFNCRTRIGSLFDPIVDKLGNGLVIIALTAARRSFEPVMLWYPAVVISKELIMAVGILYMRKEVLSNGFKSLMIGKVSSFFQTAVIMWLLLKWPRGYIIYGFSGFVAVVAAVLYVRLWVSIAQEGRETWRPLTEPEK